MHPALTAGPGFPGAPGGPCKINGLITAGSANTPQMFSAFMWTSLPSNLISSFKWQPFEKKKKKRQVFEVAENVPPYDFGYT